MHRNFTIDADEPFELLGRNTAPNPQELLMTALNACLTVRLRDRRAERGIALESVQIETSGALDLRGLLGLDPAVAPGTTRSATWLGIKGVGHVRAVRRRCTTR